MKKIFGVIILGLIAIGFSACSMNGNDVTKLSSEESLSSMAYISANLLDLNAAQTTTSLMLSDTDPLEVEEEIDEVNDYLVILKSFMENGSTNFGNIEVVESDRVLYENLINITVSGEVYSLYYNVDSVTDEVSGIFLIDDVEYEITAYNDLEDKDKFEADDDDDEEDFDNENDEDEEEFDNDDDDNDLEATTETDDEEDFDNDSDEEEDFDNDSDEEEFNDDNEEKMILIARNGKDYIEMTYKVETEEDEVESKFEMKSSINNEIKEVTIKIENEEDEYKVEIEDGNNYYEFKREVESDEIEYKLEYKVNGVEGEIKITETQDELGDTVYQYEIEEEGKSKEIEVDEDDEDDEDDDDDEDEIEEDEAI
jgi:hypothetical protein